MTGALLHVLSFKTFVLSMKYSRLFSPSYPQKMLRTTTALTKFVTGGETISQLKFEFHY